MFPLESERREPTDVVIPSDPLAGVLDGEGGMLSIGDLLATGVRLPIEPGGKLPVPVPGVMDAMCARAGLPPRGVGASR